MALETTSTSARVRRASGVGAPGRARIGSRTFRRDGWRRGPLTTAAILVFFAIYATVRIFMNRYYYVDQFHYLTPVYSLPIKSWSRVRGLRTPLPNSGGLPWRASLSIPLAPGPVTNTARRYRSLWFTAGVRGALSAQRTPADCVPVIFMNHSLFFWLAQPAATVNRYDACRVPRWRGFRVGLAR